MSFNSPQQHSNNKLEELLSKTKYTSEKVNSTLSNFIDRFTSLTLEMENMNTNVFDYEAKHTNIIQTLNLLNEIKQNFSTIPISLEKRIMSNKDYIRMTSDNIEMLIKDIDLLYNAKIYIDKHQGFKSYEKCVQKLRGIEGKVKKIFEEEFKRILGKSSPLFNSAEDFLSFIYQNESEELGNGDFGKEMMKLKSLVNSSNKKKSNLEEYFNVISKYDKKFERVVRKLNQSNINIPFQQTEDFLKFICLLIDSYSKRVFFIAPQMLRVMEKIAKELQKLNETKYIIEYVEKRRRAIVKIFNSVYPMVEVRHKKQKKKMKLQYLRNDDNDTVKTMEDERYVKGTHRFLFLTEFYLKLLEEEYQIVLRLVDGPSSKGCYQKVIKHSIKSFSDRGMNVGQRRTPNEKFFIFLDILERYHFKLKERFSKVFEQNEEGLTQINHLFSHFRDYVVSHFTEFQKELLKDKNKIEGYIHPSTSISFNLFKIMLNYKGVVEEILGKFYYKEHLPQGEKSDNYFVGKYISEVVQNTISKILNKISRKMGNKTKSSLFELNNNYHIMTKLEKREIRDNIPGVLFNKYHEIVKKNEEKFIKVTWIDLVDTLNATLDIDLKKNKKNVKKIFKNFQKEFEKISLRTKLPILNKELRDKMVEQTKQTVVPKYKQFYEKYDSFLLSEKSLIKYDTTTVNESINFLYEY